MLILNIEVLSADKRTLNINRALAQKYVQELRDLGGDLGLSSEISWSLLMDLPEVIPTEVESGDPEEWALFEEALGKACEALIVSRKDEGMALDKDLDDHVTKIGDLLEQVKELAPIRLENVRKRLDSSIEELRKKVENVDGNRFEQELIFYMEKLDINEEIVRLGQHLKYFAEMRQSPKSNGKQLQFISQEMGREINTIGSKANDSDIQKRVVLMKDELEKIKEQVLNVV